MSRRGKSATTASTGPTDPTVPPASTAPHPAVTRRSSLGAPFWRLFASSGVSNLSDGIVLAVLPLLAATVTRDPVAVSLLGSLGFVPWLLFAIPAGALVDRVNRRTAMAVANSLRAVLLVALAVLVVTERASIAVLYAVAFLLGCNETIYDNAARAVLPLVIRRSQLERGNSLLTTVESVGNIFLGAPIGAWLFALGASIPLWGNAVGYLLAALLILTVSGRFRVAKAEPTTMRHDIAAGLRWLLRHRVLRMLMVTTGFAGFAQALTHGILVLFALQNLGLSERGFGILLAVAGVGAVLGSLLSPVLTKFFGRTAAMGGCEIVGAAALLLMGLWQQPIAAAVLFAVSGGAIAAFNVQIMSVRQVLIPEELFGRVQGAYRTVIWGGIPLGMLAGGGIGAWLGLPAVFVIAGVLGIAAGVASWWVLQRSHREIADAFAEHDQSDN